LPCPLASITLAANNVNQQQQCTDVCGELPFHHNRASLIA